jgi:hypothetical protein
VKVGSDRVTSRRSFIQGLRRKYDEELIPAVNEVSAVFGELGKRRPEFAGGDPEIELGRFLGWLRVARAPGDTWKLADLLDVNQRHQRIAAFLEDWFAVEDMTAGDKFQGDSEVDNIALLRRTFASPEAIEELTYDELFDSLSCVHAFYDRLRFVAGGLSGLRKEFGQTNSLPAIKSTITYLLHGPGAALERAYDCIYAENRRLSGFSEGCIMELLGWMDKDRPPINGRTIKALRFLGFDVKG